eukprot:2730119-Pyramimonas_sp.AAC.1
MRCPSALIRNAPGPRMPKGLRRSSALRCVAVEAAGACSSQRRHPRPPMPSTVVAYVGQHVANVDILAV